MHICPFLKLYPLLRVGWSLSLTTSVWSGWCAESCGSVSTGTCGEWRGALTSTGISCRNSSARRATCEGQEGLSKTYHPRQLAHYAIYDRHAKLPIDFNPNNLKPPHSLFPDCQSSSSEWELSFTGCFPIILSAPPHHRLCFVCHLARPGISKWHTLVYCPEAGRF